MTTIKTGTTNDTGRGIRMVEGNFSLYIERTADGVCCFEVPNNDAGRALIEGVWVRWTNPVGCVLKDD